MKMSAAHRTKNGSTAPLDRTEIFYYCIKLNHSLKDGLRFNAFLAQVVSFVPSSLFLEITRGLPFHTSVFPSPLHPSPS
jgi:hypothetical protein